MATRQLDSLVHYLRRATVPASANALADETLLTRFVTRRDEGAFETLVRRHGPMVLAVCRRLLHDGHAAEDAFQATFLVLARKAGSLRQPEQLAPWLHGVAHRTALRARVEAARRRLRESRAPAAAPTLPADALDWQDLRPVLDEEINRLPQRYRTPFVLCYLEGQTNAEAARRLGYSRGTVATLLARARERLRHRLLRRGLAPSVGFLAAALASQSQAMPVALGLAAVRAAVSFAAGAVSAPAASLAQGVMKAMLMTRLKIVVAVLLAVGLVGGGMGVASYRAAAPPVRAKPSPQPVAPLEEPDRPEGLPIPAAVPVPAPPPAVAVPEDGNPVTQRTANFVITGPTAALAKRIGQAAERQRKTQALRWLGCEMPQWPKPCPLRVKITNAGIGGATSFQFDRGKVLNQEMRLEGPLDRLLKSVLPHEVTHTVLAFHFKKPIPRWADEGASLLSEDAAEQARHEKMLRQVLDQGRRIPVRRLFTLHDFPRDVLALYCEGYSLSRFLVQAGGRKTFLKFVADGMESKWDAAVKKHYSYRTVEELEAAWLASVARLRPAKDPTAAKPARAKAVSEDGPAPNGEEALALEKRLRASLLPAGPAPIQGLASLSREGRLRLWKRVTAYAATTLVTERGERVNSYVPVQSVQEVQYDLGKVRVFDTHGKTIEARKLTGLLKGDRLVLVFADGQPVDPLHLRLVKEGTLILALPALPATPAVLPGDAIPPAPTVPAVPVPKGGTRETRPLNPPIPPAPAAPAPPPPTEAK